MSLYGTYGPILDHRELTGMIRKAVPVPSLAIREIFTARRTVATKTFEVDIVHGRRTRAKWNSFGSSATKTTHRRIAKQPFTLGKIFSYRDLDEEDMKFLRQPGTEHENYMRGRVAEILREAAEEIMYLVEATCWDALKGTITIGQSPDVQNPIVWSTTIPVTTINSPGVSDWVSSPTAPILSNDISAIRNAYRDLVGLELGRAYANSTVTDGFLVNTELKNWYKATINTVLESRMIKQLGDWNFTRWDEGYEVTDGGNSVTKNIPDKNIFLMPAGNPMRCTIAEGTNMIPRQAIGGGDDVVSEVPPGMFSYAEAMTNPVGIRIYYGYSFTPYIEWPEACLRLKLKGAA